MSQRLSLSYEKLADVKQVFNGTFRANKRSIDWLAEAGDGVYAYASPEHDIVLESFDNLSGLTSQASGNLTSRVLVRGEDVKGSDGSKLGWVDWSVSADMKFMIFKTEARKGWRHSSYGQHIDLSDTRCLADSLMIAQPTTLYTILLLRSLILLPLQPHHP